MPKVSILMLSFNHEAFIEEAVSSAVSQDWDDLEVVVADDASTDRTPALLQELAARHPGRLRVILNPRNLGVTRNCNVAFEACRGELVAILGGDDVMLPGKVRHQAGFMQSDPACALSFHDMEIFGDGATRLFSANHPPLEGDGEMVAMYGTWFPAPSVMIRNRPGLRFAEEIPVSSDWLFWIDVVEAGPGMVRNAGGVWSRYRRHAGNITANEKGVLEERLLTLKLARERHPRLATACRKGRARLYAEAAFAQAGSGRALAAVGSLLRGAAASPSGLAGSVRTLLRLKAPR